MRQEAFLRVRLNPDGSVAPEARARGLEGLRAASVSPLQSLSGGIRPASGGLPSQRVTNPWNFLGPQPIKDNYQNGGAGIYGFGNASVKINALAVSTDGAVVFAGSIGGIAKSTDGGVSWRYVSDGLPSQSIFSLTIDSTNPSIVYAGTGDDTFSGQGGNALMSVGIYRSTDMGETWGRFAESSLSDRAIYKILVDPATSGSQTSTTLWLGARQGNNTAGGIFKSLDSGQTWTLKLSGSVYDMAIDTTTSPPTLYAARLTNGLYKSVDGGENWTNISALGPNNPNGNKNGVGAAGGVVYYSNSDGSYNTAYGNPSSGRVYKSTDQGASWTEVAAARGFCGGQCFYDQYVEPNPYDPSMVIFGGVDPSTSPNAGANVYDVAPFAGGPIIHSDQHSVAFVNGTTVYIGNDGGVYKTVDGGLNWVNLSTGLAGGLVIGVSASGDGGLLAGLQDNGSVARFAGETDWRVVRGGDGGFNKIDPGDSAKGYSMYVTVGAVQSTLIKRTVNSHANTTNITPAAAVGVESAMFYSPFFMDPETGSRILWGAENLYRSVDSGDTWTRIGDIKTMTAGTKIATIMEAPSSGNHVYVGLQDYTVLVTSDADNGNAATWNVRTAGLPDNQFPTAFAVHPATPSTAYVSFAQYGSAASPKLHVFKTTDTGLSWVGVSTGLPDVPVIDLVIDTQAPNSLFAATDVGVFSSLDGAKTWTRSDIGMPEGLIASALSLNSGTRKLTAGTYGRGAYQLDLPQAAPVPTGLAGTAMGRSSATFTWAAPGAQYNVQAYGVYYSTDPTVLITSVTAPTVSLTGLTPNTTYSVAVTAANALLESANSTAAAAVTLASAPVGVGLGVYLSSVDLTVSIDAGGNPADTQYDRQVSTDDFTSVLLASRTFGATLSPLTGLAGNTTYYFRSRAVNRAGVPTDFTAVVATPTWAAIPSSAAASGVGSSSITANWGANGNGGLTPYKVELSTDAFVSVSTSQVLMALSKTFTGLAASTSYYFRVSAFSHRDGVWTSTVALPTTMTSAAAPASVTASAWSELDVGALSLTPRWTSTFSSGTAYTAQISTDSFLSINVASVTFNDVATFSGLTRNTSYYIRVSTDAGTGPYAVFAATSTRAASPSVSAFQPQGPSSMTVTFFDPNNNPVGTLYQVFLSTTGSLAQAIASSHTFSLSSTFTALSPNTTYFATVRALSRAGAGGGEVTVDSATFAAAPSSGSLSGVTASVVVLNWLTNGNPPDTFYEAAVSTEAAFDSQLSSAVTMSTGVAFGGLTANTTYYFAAQALNRKGIPSDLLPTLSTSTLVNPPVAGTTSLAGFALTGAWGANGNGPTTLYELQLSSDGFATTMASSQTFGAQATFPGLAGGTTYFLRVRAFGHHHGQWTTTVALSSAVTPTSPTITAGAYTAVATGGFTVSWVSGFPGGTTYYASISTDNFATVNTASVTLNTFGGVTGLQTNTTYYARVSTGAAGPFTSLGSTSTLAAAPVFSSSYVLGASSAAVTWAGAGNPVGTLFEARVRTEALAVWASSRTLSSTATFTALTPNATWFLDVRALSHAGAGTAYTSTGTVLTPPVAPGTVTASLGLSSAAVSFSGGGNAAGTVYLVAASTDSGMSPLASSATVVGSSAALSGLAVNTSYYFAAQARGFGGTNADSVIAGPFSTLAADPVYSSATIGVSSVVFSWSANGNPAGTGFLVQVSSDAFATMVDSGQLTDTSVELSGLGANTTYYLRIRAVSHGGVANAFVSSSAWTYAAAPGAAAPSAVSTQSLAASWTAAGNSAVTVYTAQLSTDSAFGPILASSVTRLTSASFSGLSANTTYYTRVRAAGFGGDVTAFTTLPATMTLLSSPGLAGASFASVSSAALTAQWTSGGNGAGTLYTALLSTDDFTTTAASSDTYNVNAVFTGLTPNTTYYVKARAASGGNVSAYLTLGSTATAVNVPTGAAVAASSQTTATLGWAANGNAAGTWYTAQASTDSFASVLSSTLTLGPAATFSGLTANTTYQLRVRAEGWSSVPSAYTASVATATHPAAPISLVSLNAQVDFILASWGSGGNPAGTRYTLVASTNPSLLPAAVSASTTSTSVTVSTLAANTSHYLAVTAAGHNGAVSAPALLGPIATRPDDVLVVLDAVFQSSLTFTITPQRNPAGTTYRLTFSTDSYLTTALTADTTQTAVAQTGLTPNTTYQFRVQPIGPGGAATASLLSTATYAAAPVAAAPSGVSTSAFTANWTSGGNSVVTLYRAQLSTDAFTTVSASSLTYGASAAFAGLTANTTYYTRVRAEGHNGTPSAYVTLPSTTTPLLSPAAAGTTFTTVGSSSLTVAWASGGNGAGTTYVAEVSTDDFATVSAASSTFNLSALYGTGGFGPALLPATTYYARVRSANGVNSSANVVLGSTATLAYPPAGTVVLSVTSTTASLDWQPNGDPEPGTQYQVWRDVSAGFTAPTITVVSTTAATAAGLSASSSYFFKVRALTATGYVSAFDAAVSTATLPPTPGAPGTPAGTALGVSSISWSWTAAADSPSFYRVYAASNPAALVASTVPASFVQSALAPNTPYGIRVTGVNASGEGVLSAAATVYTLAAPPSGTALVAAYGSSATLSWSLNGNPAGTLAEVHSSTTSGVFASSPTLTSTQTHTEYGLIGCTTYYLKVRSRNGDAFLSAFDATVQFLTAASTPSAPSGLVADPLTGNRISLSWTPSPTEGVTGYRLYYDNGSGVISYAAPLAVLTSTETSFTTGLLPSSTVYNFALRARHRCDVEETSGVFAAAASVGALASVRAQIKSPDSGKRIKGNRVSIVAELTAGAPYQVSSVTFQMRLQGAPAWTTIVPPDAALHPNPDLDAPYFIHWDVNSIANGTYELRAVAYDVAGTSDTAPGVTVVSVVGAGAVDFDISEGTVVDASGNAAIKKDQVINTAVVNTVVASGDSAADPSVKVQLPAGALTGSTVTVSVIANPTIPSTSAPAGFTLAGSAIQIDLSNGQTALNGNAVLTLSFPDTLAIGGGQELDIQSYDPLTGAWSDIGATTTDSVTHTATASTPHFSIFAVIVGAGAQSDLARARVYPVPYKPNSGNPNEGKPYSAGDATSGIIFDRLPAMVKLQIFTLSGRLVAEFETTAGTGTIQWDVRNADGRDVASGGYFAVISSPGHKSVVKKLAVIR